jgi:hypothetical protein
MEAVKKETEVRVVRLEAALITQTGLTISAPKQYSFPLLLAFTCFQLEEAFLGSVLQQF